MISDQAILDALADELRATEQLRREVMVDLLNLCAAMHKIQKILTPENMARLTRNDWEDKQASGHLADACVAIMRCCRTIETGLEEYRVEPR